MILLCNSQITDCDLCTVKEIHGVKLCLTDSKLPLPLIVGFVNYKSYFFLFIFLYCTGIQNFNTLI